MTLMDPVAITVDALVAAGHTDVHPTGSESGISKLALSAPEYVWVQEETGSTAHIRYSDQPVVSIVVYSNLGASEATKKARAIQRELLDAQGTKFTSGGFHRVATVVRPYRQDIQGLPQGVGRAVAQYSYTLSDESHWE